MYAVTRLHDLTGSIRLLFALSACLLGITLAGCPSPDGSENDDSSDVTSDVGDNVDSVSDDECSTHSDCYDLGEAYCDDGTCVSDGPGWAEDGDSWDDSDVSDTTDTSDVTDPECVFDTDCPEGFRCSDDSTCVPLSDAGDTSTADVDDADNLADTSDADDADDADADDSCDPGEQYNPITGECVPIDAG
jgi:hypothetical protein